MTSNEIRNRFLKFFESRGHRMVRSSSLVPANDPTLLFSNAGMNQFKDVFLGLEKRAYSRACSAQKCVRAGGKHNDLEQVGRTRRHNTFFEMLGNFSFGDYFKKEAIPWAWELVTKEFAIPKEKLYATVFREDDEAEEIWAKIIPRERIFRFDEKDNFWQMGETGPCGPCSEIHYDMGPEASDLGHKDCKFPCPDDCGRYVEIWNLVFMQFNRDEQGQMTPLPRPSIDTGAGLERMAAVLQGKLSNFDTDLFAPIREAALGLLVLRNPGSRLMLDSPTEPRGVAVSENVIADHARAFTFLISDGVVPGNDGRGYVLRKIIRRAIRHARLRGAENPFLYELVPTVVQLMQSAYPELEQNENRISGVVRQEELRFGSTVALGLGRLDEDVSELIEDAAKAHSLAHPFQGIPERIRERAMFQFLSHKGVSLTYPGEKAFKLYDTFGLPLDLIEDSLGDTGIALDKAGFDHAMAQQRERARASWKGAEKKAASPVYQQVAEKQKTLFEGYLQTASSDCRIVALVEGGNLVEGVKPGAEPREVEIILDHTPFYAEAGGQVGDTGRFFAADSDHEVAHVTDTYRPVSGVTAHKATARDTLRVGDTVTAVVDAERRDAIRRNHTATHLLHAALRTTLGTHVKQAGSLVAPDRLRFDFSHFAELGEQDLLDIEDLVNRHILKNEEVRTDLMGIDQAIESGAMALFGEKYGDRVRVLSVADGSFSRELCGGTHVGRTGDIGLFKIVSEGSVAAGTRRIEAITGMGVLEYLRKASGTLALLGNTLRSKPEEVLEAAKKLAESEKKLRKQLDAQQMKRATAQAGDLLDQARDIKGVRVVSARVEGVSRPAMRQMVDQLRARLGSGVIALGAVADGKAALIIGVTTDLTARLDAGKIVRQAAALMEGSGGGRKDLAEAGGKNPEKLDECVQAVRGIVESML